MQKDQSMTFLPLGYDADETTRENTAWAMITKPGRYIPNYTVGADARVHPITVRDMRARWAKMKAEGIPATGEWAKDRA
jgi:hypothetical protein